MNRRSFFVKLFAGNLLLVAAITAVSCGISYYYLDNEHAVREETRQAQLLGVVRQHFERIGLAQADQVDRDCKALMSGMEARVTVMNPDGRVLGDSQADPAKMVNHKTADRPEVLAALAGHQGRDRRPSETLGIEFRYFAAPLQQDGRTVGAVRVAMPVSALVARSSFIRRAVLWAGLSALGAAVVLGLLTSWLWYAPIRQITHTARQIASGDLEHRARLRGSAELVDLGQALNEMRQSLAGQIELIERQREDLSAVIANLREGVIALDRDDHVVLMNASARELLAPAEGDVAGRHVQSVVRVPAVVEALTALQALLPVERQVEVEIGPRPRTLHVHAARMPGSASRGITTLLVVRDITELARAAAMKAEFVANASHELRTPLATLRAAVDSLDAIAPDDRAGLAKVTGILHRHVKRLEDMTNDLLDLHLIERARSKLKWADVALGELERWLGEQFAAQAEDKQVRLALATRPDHGRFRTDERMVKLILQNLVDNALKFTPAGGEVACDLTVEAGQAVLTVRDTGVGIPKELQGRVFERFFQADPSRARAAGQSRGTGLGLAIVKYAAERLGAKVELASAPGKGTTVTVRIVAHAAS